MPERTFLIQRYCRANWPQVSGQRPFIATGPNFTAYTTTRKIEEYEWKFREHFIEQIKTVGESADRLSREIVAELLLREGIVQALWSVDSGECLPEEEWWQAAITQLADEIPSKGPLWSWVIELLSGLADPSHFRSYVSDDQLTLSPMSVPAE